MSLQSTNQDYISLQDRLDALREKIDVKRKQAREQFQEIMRFVTRGLNPNEISDSLRAQLEGIKKILDIGDEVKQNGKAQAEDKLKGSDELTLEEIISALGSTVSIDTKKLEEKLKQSVIARLAAINANIGKWQSEVKAGDLVAALNDKQFSKPLDKVGMTPPTAVSHAISLAEQKSSLVEKLDKLNKSTSQAPLPSQPTRQDPNSRML